MGSNWLRSTAHSPRMACTAAITLRWTLVDKRTQSASPLCTSPVDYLSGRWRQGPHLLPNVKNVTDERVGEDEEADNNARAGGVDTRLQPTPLTSGLCGYRLVFVRRSCLPHGLLWGPREAQTRDLRQLVGLEYVCEHLLGSTGVG